MSDAPIATLHSDEMTRCEDMHLILHPRDRCRDNPLALAAALRSMTALRWSFAVQLPKCITIQDWPIETDPERGKLSSNSNHRCESRHLVRVSDSLPKSNIVHRIVRAVDADVVGDISIHGAYPFF